MECSGWMGGWMGGSKSRVKDCLQQSKIVSSDFRHILKTNYSENLNLARISDNV